MSVRIMFSTRMRADWTLPTYKWTAVSDMAQSMVMAEYAWLPCSGAVHCVLDRKKTVAYLDQLRHLSPLLLDFRAIFLLHHAQSRYRQLELYLELVLPRVRFQAR